MTSRASASALQGRGLRMAAVCLVAVLTAAAGAEPAPGSAASPAEVPVERLADGRLRIGRVELDPAARTVRCPGRVNMAAGGPIELLACLPTGKTHESVLVLDVAPIHLQVALLLLDLRPGRNPAVEPPERGPPPAGPPGARVAIAVEWTPPGDGERHRLPAGELLLNVETDEPLRSADWVFLGSRTDEHGFGADRDGSLVTTFHDPLAVLELAHPTVNDDVYYFVRETTCPPVGTPIVLEVRAPAREAASQDAPAEEPRP